jgi:hypothetical protein
MFDFDDPWWLIAVVLVVVLWVMGAIIPVRLVAPRVSVEQHFLTNDESPEQDVPPPVQRPSVLLPTLVFLVGLGLVALSVSKRMNEPEGGNRWMWLAAAAGLSSFWGLLLILFTMKMR